MEYKILSNSWKTEELLEQELNSYAKLGWEVVHFQFSAGITMVYAGILLGRRVS